MLPSRLVSRLGIFHSLVEDPVQDGVEAFGYLVQIL